MTRIEVPPVGEDLSDLVRSALTLARGYVELLHRNQTSETEVRSAPTEDGTFHAIERNV